MRKNAQNWQMVLDRAEQTSNDAKFFTQNQWIFDNQQAVKIYNMSSEDDRKCFSCDVTKINWEYYIMN
jgi:hypothetical protein